MSVVLEPQNTSDQIAGTTEPRYLSKIADYAKARLCGVF